MSRFIEGEARSQSVLFPERLEDWIAEDNPVRAVDAFVEELDLAELGFAGAAPAETGRPAYHPAMLLKIYIYGYLNRIPSSRRLERETQRNVELMWLTGRLAPDFKTIADFRRDNGEAVRRVCREFIELSRQIGLFGDAVVAIDGSKFKAVNNRDKNFTPHKLKARMQQLEESIARYLNDLDRADREPTSVPAVRVTHLKEKMATVKEQVRKLRRIEKQLQEAPDRASLAHRSRCSLDGDQRPWDGHRGLQRSGSGRYRAPHDRRARGHQRRPRPDAIDRDVQTGPRCPRPATDDCAG